MRRFLGWTSRSGPRARLAGRRRAGMPPTASKPSAVALVHFADRWFAVPGETVTFTAWILNDSQEQLHNICLILRSFTNENLETLGYSQQPPTEALSFGALHPGGTARFTFQYVVTDSDATHGGTLVSALQVKATSTDLRTLWDECDAVVQLA